MVLKKTGPLRAVAGNAGSWRLEGRGVWWHILTKQKSSLIFHTAKGAENGDERKTNKKSGNDDSRALTGIRETPELPLIRNHDEPDFGLNHRSADFFPYETGSIITMGRLPPLPSDR